MRCGDAEHRMGDLGSSGADESGEADDLAGADREVDARDAGRPQPRDRQDDRRVGAAAGAWAETTLRAVGPSIASTRDASVSAAVGAVRITRPSRRTVTVSASSSTSRRKWEMRRIVLPWAASDFTISWRRAVSAPLSAAVGSSMMTTSAARESARRISTSCCSATRSERAGTVAAEVESGGAHEGLVALPQRSPLHDARGRGLGAEEDVLGDTQLRHDRRLLSDGRDPVVERLSRRAQRDPLAAYEHLAAVWRENAGEDLSQRGLARAVLADQRMHRPGLGPRPSRSVSAFVPPKCLETARASRKPGSPGESDSGMAAATAPSRPAVRAGPPRSATPREAPRIARRARSGASGCRSA